MKEILIYAAIGLGIVGVLIIVLIMIVEWTSS